MNIIEFNNYFPDEVSAQNHIQCMREKEGIICRKCQHSEHYWCKSIGKWTCKNCHYQT